MPTAASDTKCSPRPGPTTRTTGAQPPPGPPPPRAGGGLRGSHVTRCPQPPPRAARCLPPPREQVRGGPKDIAARGRRPHRLCAILPRRSRPPPPPGADGASPAGQVAARRPRTLPPRRAVRHRPGPAAQRREGKGTGRCRPALQRYRHRYRTSARLTLRTAPLRSPQPGGGSGGGPCWWEKARRAAPSPLRAQPPPNRSARRVPAGAAVRPRVGQRSAARPVPRAPPPRRRPLGGGCSTATAGLRDRPLGVSPRSWPAALLAPSLPSERFLPLPAVFPTPPLRESARPGSWRPLRARGGGRRSLAWVGTPSNATARRGPPKREDVKSAKRRQPPSTSLHVRGWKRRGSFIQI